MGLPSKISNDVNGLCTTFIKVISALILLFYCAPSYTQQSDNREKKNYEDKGFFTFILPINAIEGEFNGQLVLSTGEIVVPVQDFENGIGWGFALGGGLGYGGFEFGYSRSEHLGRWEEEIWTGYQNIAFMDGKFSPLKNSPVRPYLLLGCGMAWLNVKDGAYTIDETMDATYKDFAWRIGGGVHVQVWRILLDANWIYSSIKYTSVTPKGRDWITIEDGLNANVKSINVGIGFLFEPR